MKLFAYIALGIPGWLLQSALSLPLQLAGLVIVPVLAGLRRYNLRPSGKYPGRIVLAWRDPWAWPWGNEEDGIDGSANGVWPKEHGFKLWRQIVRWSALRNTIANTRWWPLLGATARGNAQHIVGDPDKNPWGPWAIRQGLLVEVRLPWGKPPCKTFTIGWKLDAARYPMNAGKPSVPGCQFSLQAYKPLV